MKISAIIVSMAIWSFSSLSFSGDWVGNGGGLAENNIVFAYKSLERFIGLCIQSKSCAQEEDQDNALRKIYVNLPEERARNSKQVIIKRDPDFFRRAGNGFPRLAVTGNNIGDPIFINKDMLYTKKPDGTVWTLGLSESISILVHELGHHNGIKNHTWLDGLGAQVAAMIYTRIQSYSYSPKTKHLSVRLISFRNTMATYSPAQLIFIDNHAFYDLSDFLFQKVTCPRAGEFRFGPVGLTLWNSHWRYDRLRQKYLNTTAIAQCQNNKGEVEEQVSGQFYVYADVVRFEDQNRWNPNGFYINYYPCSIKNSCQSLKEKYSSAKLNKNIHQKEKAK